MQKIPLFFPFFPKATSPKRKSLKFPNNKSLVNRRRCHWSTSHRWHEPGRDWRLPTPPRMLCTKSRHQRRKPKLLLSRPLCADLATPKQLSQHERASAFIGTSNVPFSSLFLSVSNHWSNCLKSEIKQESVMCFISVCLSAKFILKFENLSHFKKIRIYPP